MGWVSRGSLNYISRCLEVPPAELWGVDAFDQPEVEAFKVLTRQYLSQRQKS